MIMNPMMNISTSLIVAIRLVSEHPVYRCIGLIDVALVGFKTIQLASPLSVMVYRALAP